MGCSHTKEAMPDKYVKTFPWDSALRSREVALQSFPFLILFDVDEQDYGRFVSLNS